MPNFIEDNGTLQFPKTDLVAVPAGADTSKYYRATDWNEACQALVDTKGVLRGAKWIGLTTQAADPAPASIAAYLWPHTDGSLHFKRPSGDSVIATMTDVLSGGSVEHLTASGATSPSATRTFVSGAGVALTLANGTFDGLTKQVIVASGTGSLTPAVGPKRTWSGPTAFAMVWDHIAVTWRVASEPRRIIDLTAEPYNVIANDTSAAVLESNRIAIQSALELTDVVLVAPPGRIYADKGVLYRTWSPPAGSRRLTILGYGRDTTTFVQYGTGAGGDWYLFEFASCSDVEIIDCGFEQGLIAWPDGGQQNHLVVVANNIAGGITKNIRLRRVRFGKCLGDALRMLSNASPEVVENITLDDFDMVLNGVVFPNWAANTAYQIGMRVVNDAAKQYICVKAGTSAVSGGPTGDGLITFADLPITAVDIALDTLTSAAHARLTGDGPARFTTTGALPGGLATATDYWLIVTDANTLKVATTAINAHAGVAIDLTSAGTGTNVIEDVLDKTRRTILDGTAVWNWVAPRFGARSGIALQRGFRNVSFKNGRIIGSQNSLIDFEPTVSAEMNGFEFENIIGDNSLGNTASAMSFSGVSGGENIKNGLVRNVTCLHGRVNIGGCDNTLFDRLTVINNTVLPSDPAAVNLQVRQDCNDLTFRDLRLERNGGTAAMLFDYVGLNPGSRLRIEGGVFVQNTLATPIYIDGAPNGLHIDGPTIRYTAATGAAGIDAIMLQAITSDIDICRINDVKIHCTTGVLHSAITMMVRTPRLLTNIRVTDIAAQGEATFGVYMNIGTTGTPVVDAHPTFSNIMAATPWIAVDGSDNPLPDRVWPRMISLTAATFEGYETPETNVTAPVGSVYTQLDGASPAWYKETGVLTTGWRQHADARPNIARNGGFWFAQRQAPAVATTYSDTAGRAISADGFGITNENASVTFARVDTAAAAEAGLRARYYGSFTKITTAGKLMVSQVISSSNMSAVRGRTVRLQAKIKGTVAQTVRLGLLQLTAAGVVDVIPAVFVSAFNAAGVDPTFGAALAKIAPKAGVTLDNAASVASAANCAVTTAWQRFGAVFEVPADAKNLIAVAWSDGLLAATAGFSLSEVSLTEGGEVQTWAPGSVDAELRRVQRYYQKTFGVDVAPIQLAGVGTGELVGILGRAAAAAEAAVFDWRLPVRMRAAPTITTFNPAAANAQARQTGGTAADLTATAVSGAGEWGAVITATGVAGGAVGDRTAVHATASAEL